MINRHLPPLLRRALRPLLDPYRRFRHARLIHALRVSVGLVATILLTTGIHLPHGEWASVTMLIVIGGLQHHGNIRRKATERAYGTLIGAAIGLAIVVQQSYLGWHLLTYVLMSSACGFFAYHAIGKGGYTALLSAITVFIVAGHGDNPMSDGLWRTVDILIGNVLALAFSFALPLYAVYSWRYNLATTLRECAAVHGRIVAGDGVTSDTHLKRMRKLSASLVQLRGLMASVSKEVHVSQTELDALQRNLRLCISILEILADTRPAGDDASAMEALRQSLQVEHRFVRRQWIAMARALRDGNSERLRRSGEPYGDLQAQADYPALDGYRALTRQLVANVDDMRQRLAKTAPRWSFSHLPLAGEPEDRPPA
ncbi:MULTISPECIES: FUSC family protein [unclassified Pseudomonas]|uniref:FUSC family protein n=1 Tax=unclassified Pseudomonas TaxID=196821 RepID=UPI000BC612A8|nr:MULTISPECIES: FUSC family protein [unclassified Pseudomonas]PVZ19846.1 fusaric acid resistance family protein [Pseudomonas sp. URIL14HWK12:I12]PVZ26912.1 fusaric acid resistance family protein [Pseudomonas sp. URIL14HWK12:I10]PVZ37801.1 fusaric acid resistance family protein [Pseudomonas sp. URIL14HWK12:I11]SNZ05614.1 Predicted membrane protein [Pseudomonas sp. URIL14HWK12:I9]